MGGVCTGGTLKRSTAADHDKSSVGFSGKLSSVNSFNHRQNKKTDYEDGNDDSVLSSSYTQDDDLYHRKTTSYDSGELFFSISRELKPSTPARVGANKAPHVTTFLGKAGSVGLEVSILAFEVANTIVKGSNLMQSLSQENIQILKNEILHSQGVQLLVSTDMKELLTIAAADKREEFEVFSREVVKFGDMCKDPQWHNLDRFFARLDLDPVTNKQLREEAEITMQELANLAQHTSELYHELIVLDRLEQLYWRKIEEMESLHLSRKGKSLVALQSELKHQRKLIKNLKKKSLWSKNVEEVVEKLCDVVISIHQTIVETFKENAENSTTNGKEANEKTERLGVAGLALHYANLITQMNNIALHPTCLPPNMRHTLYNGLPATVKASLRSRLQDLDSKEVMTMPQIKAEMEKTLHWLVPLATETTKAHHGFGWVGEWGNTGCEFRKKTLTSNNVIRLQTLYYADKHKMDRYILDLIIHLHRLISLARCQDTVPKPTPENRSNPHPKRVEISSKDKNLLAETTKQRTVVPGVSKSREPVTVKNWTC